MWLMETEAGRSLEQVYSSGITITDEQQTQLNARFGSDGSDQGSRILSVAGSSAEISIQGVLTNTPDFRALFFGGGNTTYSEIVSALLEAEASDSVKDITLAIDSPGGNINGLFATIEAIQQVTKPTRAVISNVGASAAFALASQADTLIASNHATLVGSIGVVSQLFVDEKIVTLTSTKAPKKAPDVSTAQGKKDVIAFLDDLHSKFVGEIARGRGVSVETVNSKFGQGGVLVASEAVKKGMIDEVLKPSLKIVTPNSIETKSEEIMDLNTLKAEHRELYNAVLNLGVQQERDRVTAHLTLGEASGDMKTTVEAIADGSELTSKITATHMAAGMNRTDLNANLEDGDNSNAGDGAGGDSAAGTGADAVQTLLQNSSIGA